MYLIGGLEPWNFMTFHILGIIIPTGELIFFRGVGQPPTRYSATHIHSNPQIDRKVTLLVMVFYNVIYIYMQLKKFARNILESCGIWLRR